MRSLTNSKGQTGGMMNVAVGAVMLIVIVGAISYIGFLVNSKIKGTIDQGGFSTAENTSYAALESNVLSGFDLLGVLFVVAAAAAIFILLRGGLLAGGGGV